MAAGSAHLQAHRHPPVAPGYRRRPLGGDATAAALSALPSERWVVLRDVARPGRRSARLDHVAIGPSGVFVIASKDWSGRVSVERGALRHNGRARTQALRGADAAASAVAGLVPALPRKDVRAVLAFSGTGPNETLDEVSVCTTDTLLGLLVSEPVVFDSVQVRSVAGELRRGLAPSVDGPDRPPSGLRRLVGLLRPLIGVALVATVLINPDLASAGVRRVSEAFADQPAPTEELLDGAKERARKRLTPDASSDSDLRRP